MKRISFLLLVLMLLMPARAAAIKVDDFKYFDVKECGLPLVNHGFDDAVGYYGRLSASLEGQVRDMVWYLAQNNAGVAVRFRSNATAFAARWTLINDFKMNHMAPTGIGGCDLYGYENGEWRYVGTARPSGKESKAIINSYVDGKMRDYVLFLPLYDGVSSLAIGVNEGAVVEKPEADGLNAFKGSAEKPLVFFGHSGLQGGCASRPGMVYTSILSRMLKRECINLGFSGLGQMYTIMAKEMNRIDADAYILDCLGNNYLQMVRDSSELFVRTILREHPTTPLIFMSSYADVTEWCGADPESEGPKKEAFVRNLCEKLRGEGYTNVHYLDMHGPREDASNTLIGSSAFGSTEGTVDGGHLTDYGFQQIAEFLYPLFSAPDGLLADASSAKGGLNELNIIPCPNKVEAGRGTFNLQSGKVEYITDKSIPEEGYRIEITPERAAVSASGKAGFLFAGQTLRQLEVNGDREHNIYPDSLRVQGGINHVQGIAYDKKEKCFYCSFTTAFYKVSPEGKVLDGIEEIHGHLGALTFDEESRKVYASLECKDDEIGRNISKGMGKEGYTHGESRFYIAEIDVDNMTMTTHELPEVRDDYLAGRYGCSGIDGVSIAPRFGRKGGEAEYLYVAYGVYGDTSRSDNDYNILLCYRPGNYSKPVRKYFVHTGNTTYGVQNLCYDSFTDRLYMAVYRGKKEAYPNYALFALDMDQKPSKGYLEGVPYEKGKVLLLDSFTGWHQNLGSTGICSMGDGYFYIGVNGKDNGRQVCDFTLYRYSESEEGPFKRGVGEN